MRLCFFFGIIVIKCDADEEFPISVFFSFQVIYEGSSHFFKVNKLQETTNYNFRIYASNDVGSGPYSEIYTFSTTKAPPPAVRGECMCTKQHRGRIWYSNFIYLLLIAC